MRKQNIAILGLAGMLAGLNAGCLAVAAGGIAYVEGKQVEARGRERAAQIQADAYRDVHSPVYVVAGTPNYEPSAIINSIDFEHDVYVKGQRGLNLKTTFTVFNGDGRTANLSAYLYYKNGHPVMDLDGVCRTPTGKVAFQSEKFPLKTGSYENIIFIPHEQMELDTEKHKGLIIDVSLWDSSPQGGEFAKKRSSPITYRGN